DRNGQSDFAGVGSHTDVIDDDVVDSSSREGPRTIKGHVRIGKFVLADVGCRSMASIVVVVVGSTREGRAGIGSRCAIDRGTGNMQVARRRIDKHRGGESAAGIARL